MAAIGRDAFTDAHEDLVRKHGSVPIGLDAHLKSKALDVLAQDIRTLPRDQVPLAVWRAMQRIAQLYKFGDGSVIWLDIVTQVEGVLYDHAVECRLLTAEQAQAGVSPNDP